LATQWSAIAVVYLIIVSVLFVASHDHWLHTRQGTVAEYASVGLSFFLAREMMRHGVALDFLAGGEAERRVASALDPLRSHGWDVVHDTKKDWGGNVDHLVLAPRMAFAIEQRAESRLGERAHECSLGKAEVRPVVGECGAVRAAGCAANTEEGRSGLGDRPGRSAGAARAPSRHLTSLKFAANTHNARLAGE
jgi:hypothetical protein